MKKTLKILLCVLLCAVLIGAGVFVYTQAKIKYYENTFFPMKEDFNQLEQIVTWYSNYAYDTDDLTQVVGVHDYVFIGKIEKVEGTRYEDAFFNDLLQFYASPVSQYKVSVVKNIKGNLRLEEIPMTKCGGLSCKGRYIEIGNGDPMPLEHKYYILFANADEKGEMSIGLGNICLGENEADALNADNADVKKILDAFNNQDESVRIIKGHTSKYEQQTDLL